MNESESAGVSVDGSASLYRPDSPLSVVRQPVSASPLWAVAACPDKDLVVVASEDGSLYYLAHQVESWRVR
jgi:hypothetical protein